MISNLMISAYLAGLSARSGVLPPRPSRVCSRLEVLNGPKSGPR